MILDTSFAIDLLAGDDAAVAKFDEIADRQLTIPTFVYTEVGVGFDPETPTETHFEEIMQQVTLVPYNSEAARRAVGIQRQLRKQGDRIGAVNVMIAGIALARDAPVVTRNVSECAQTPVQVSSY